MNYLINIKVMKVTNSQMQQLIWESTLKGGKAEKNWDDPKLKLNRPN